MSVLKKHYKKTGIDAPVCHFVLGSGYSSSLDQLKAQPFFKNWEEGKEISFQEISELPSPTIASHRGIYRYFVHKKKGFAISFQCGRIHAYEGHCAKTVVQPVMQVFLSGTKNFVLSNISGSLKKEYHLGTVIALKDHINMTGLSPLVGAEPKNSKGELLGLRFPDMSQIYDPKMREEISSELLSKKVRVTPGIYLGLLGPELETPAQIKWFNKSSGSLIDAVGMSTVLEAIALKQAGATLSAFSLISNFATGVDSYDTELSFDKMQEQIKPYVEKILSAFFSYSEKYF